METIEELRAVRLVRAASAALNLASFEWSIASGLGRCGGDTAATLVEAGKLPVHATGSDADVNAQAIYNSREPAQMLSNLEAISIEAAFILKDLHRHMEDAVVVRRLRDVGQRFSQNRRTVILTAPSITIPPELAGLVEFLDLPLPDRQRLRQIIDEVTARFPGRTRCAARLIPQDLKPWWITFVGSLRKRPIATFRRPSSAAMG
jgi:hypothetical protein